MGLDGRLLARAKDDLAAIRHKNEQELSRRRDEVYARLPEVKRLDGEIHKLMTGVIGAALQKGGDAAAAIEEIERKSLALCAEKAELLVENGYKAEYIDELYHCKKCADTGFVKGKPCVCLLALYEQEKAKDQSFLLKLGAQSFEDFDLSFYSATPDPETGVSHRKMMELVLDACRSYSATFGPESMNLLFQGDPGLGKTFLSSCVARKVAERGHSVVYETVTAAIEAFETQKFSRNEGDVEEASLRVKRLVGCDLLVLDDLGTEMVTSFSLSAVYTLINTRLLREKKTIISTNLTKEERARIYTPQITSRLEGEFAALKFVGRDVRALKKARGL